MTPTKLLIGQILIVFAIVIAGVWAATQWAAAELGYQAQLGAPWVVLLGTPVYQPWKLFEWWYAYDAYAPRIFDRAGMLAGASGFMGCAAAVVGSLWRARQNRLVTTYSGSRSRKRDRGGARRRLRAGEQCPAPVRLRVGAVLRGGTHGGPRLSRVQVPGCGLLACR
jgi:type IV secretion system protein VirD4